MRCLVIIIQLVAVSFAPSLANAAQGERHVPYSSLRAELEKEFGQPAPEADDRPALVSAELLGFLDATGQADVAGFGLGTRSGTTVGVVALRGNAGDPMDASEYTRISETVPVNTSYRNSAAYRSINFPAAYNLPEKNYWMDYKLQQRDAVRSQMASVDTRIKDLSVANRQYQVSRYNVNEALKHNSIMYGMREATIGAAALAFQGSTTVLSLAADSRHPALGMSLAAASDAYKTVYRPAFGSHAGFTPESSVRYGVDVFGEAGSRRLAQVGAHGLAGNFSRTVSGVGLAMDLDEMRHTALYNYANVHTAFRSYGILFMQRHELDTRLRAIGSELDSLMQIKQGLAGDLNNLESSLRFRSTWSLPEASQTPFISPNAGKSPLLAPAASPGSASPPIRSPNQSTSQSRLK